jgi:hypothetical protein
MLHSGVGSPLSGASIGKAPALPAIIRLGRKGLPGTNPLAYYKNSKIMAVKHFIGLAPVVCTAKLSTDANNSLPQ